VALRFEQEIESIGTQRLSGTADKENLDVITAQIARQRRLAERLRMVRADGRIVLELRNGDATIADLPELPLQNGDSIYIPRRPGTVNVLGAVFQQNAFIYRPQRSVNDYLALAGGPTGTADASQVYVIRGDGTTQSERNAGLFGTLGNEPINAGDTVVVPESIERRSWLQSLKEWTSVLYQFGLGAAGIKVLQD
jgi:polysaccharide biosynthesis/export protein